jgi:CRP-like cAMP-binding protein
MSQYQYLFQANFGKVVSISDEAMQYFDATFKERSYSSRELIVEAGNVEQYFYLVVSGVQTIYLIDRKGEKVVLGFSFDGSVSGVYDSFLSEKPSQLFLEALTPSKMIRMHKQDFDQLFELFPEFLKWRINFIENIFFGRAKREIEFLTLSAKERFDIFMKRCPPQLLNIPQKYLASYLNMKPETFSRMRAKKG